MIKSFFSLAAVGLVLSGFAYAAPMISKAKLYTSINAQPSPDCDIYTLLTLTKMDGQAVYVKFEEKVDGFCDVYRNPNVRVGLAIVKDETCGSKSLKGSLLHLDQKNSSVFEIIDHRTRLCDDKLANLVEVKFIDGNEQWKNLAGFFEKEAQK